MQMSDTPSGSFKFYPQIGQPSTKLTLVLYEFKERCRAVTSFVVQLVVLQEIAQPNALAPVTSSLSDSSCWKSCSAKCLRNVSILPANEGMVTVSHCGPKRFKVSMLPFRAIVACESRYEPIRQSLYLSEATRVAHVDS